MTPNSLGLLCTVMSGDGLAGESGPSRRTVLAGGGVLAALAASGGALVAARIRANSASVTIAAPAPVIMPSLVNSPAAGVVLHPASTSTMQSFVSVPETGEWFVTQAKPGSSRLIDPAGLAVGDIVISRLAADGSLLDSMTLPDSGHGMGLVVRVEAGARVVYTCWFAPDASGRLYDVVRVPYAPGTAARTAATLVVAGSGYPLDPSWDASADAVTLRHQGGGGPQYTRHGWADFVAGDLSRPTGQIPTPDWPPTHQGFASHGDRFYFYTGAASNQAGGDPTLITEYSWTSGQVVGTPLDAAGNSRQSDGTYPGGRMEPEGAAIVTDSGGAPSLLVGVVTGSSRPAVGPKVSRTFRYPLIAS